jgi:excisionase family DNA binding protein
MSLAIDHPVPDDRGTGMLDAYLAAIAAGDVHNVIAIGLGLIEPGQQASEVLRRLVVPAQVEVGRRWARNEWGMAEERIATHAASALVAFVNQADSGTPVHGHLLVSCVDDEQHDLAAQILASELRQAGWGVTVLGAGLPPAELRAFAARRHYDAVLLSASTPLSLVGAFRSVAAVHDLQVPVIVGGAAFGTNPSRAIHVEADGWATTAAGVSRLLEQASAAPLPRRAVKVDVTEWSQLDALRHGLANRAAAHVADAIGYELPDVARHLAALVRAIAGAVLVEEEDLLDDYVDWLAATLVARGWGLAILYEEIRALARVAPDEMQHAADLLHRMQDGLTERTDVLAATQATAARIAPAAAIAPAAPDDQARTAATTAYDPWAPQGDPVLQELAGMAAALCDAPVAYVSFIDDHHQRLKAGVGVGFAELPRHLAICSLVVAADDVVVIPDLEGDERFSSHPLVYAGPRWRFYAGAPLNAGSFVIGSLAVADYRVRLLRVDQQRQLMTLARQVMAELELRRRDGTQSDGSPQPLTRDEAERLLIESIDIRDVTTEGLPSTLGTRDIARLLNVTTRTVVNWVAQGKLDAMHTVGGHYRFSAQSVVDFLVQSHARRRA